MSHNPNTVKSQDELNEGGRKSDVLLSTIEELEKTKKQLEIAKTWLKDIADSVDIYFEKEGRSQEFTIDCLMGCGLSANQAMHEIEELNK